MKYRTSIFAGSLTLLTLAFSSGACTSELGPSSSDEDEASGGATASTGGAATGGTNTGGSSNVGGAPSAGGETSAGGTPASGGDSASGGSDTAAGGSGIEGPPATFETLKLVIQNATCNSSDCHAGGEFNDVDLRLTDDLYNNVMTSEARICGDMPVIDPGNPENSALVIILRDGCPITETTVVDGVEVEQEIMLRMPYGCFETEFENNCVPDAYIAAIQQWVADGALEN
jgi:hypothetical protein